MGKETSEQPQPQPAEVKFLFEKEQIVTFKYNPVVYLFVIDMRFNPKVMQKIYYARPFIPNEKGVNPQLIEVYESELQSIIDKEDEDLLNSQMPGFNCMHLDGIETEYKEDGNDVNFVDPKSGEWRQMTFSKKKDPDVVPVPTGQGDDKGRS